MWNDLRLRAFGLSPRRRRASSAVLSSSRVGGTGAVVGRLGTALITRKHGGWELDWRGSNARCSCILRVPFWLATCSGARAQAPRQGCVRQAARSGGCVDRSGIVPLTWIHSGTAVPSLACESRAFPTRSLAPERTSAFSLLSSRFSLPFTSILHRPTQFTIST